jgi:hypothetical protein
MKILVACEFSGIVRNAFVARGFDAWSCDLLPSEQPGNHLQCDVRDVLQHGWDIIIAHPPCTYFANSGLHYLKSRPERKEQLHQSFQLLKDIWSAPVENICIENPVGWLSTNWQRPTQIIQPYQFGHSELKTTCLWLRGLPNIKSTLLLQRPVPKGKCIRKTGKHSGKSYNYYWRQGKSAHERSRTFSGIATAMAEQWGNYLMEQAELNMIKNLNLQAT